MATIGAQFNRSYGLPLDRRVITGLTGAEFPIIQRIRYERYLKFLQSFG